MDSFPADGAGQDLHGPGAVIPPGTDGNAGQPAAAGGEQGGVPVKQTSRIKGLGIVPGCVQHQLNDAFDIPVNGSQTTNVKAKIPGDGRADLFRIEDFSLDPAAVNRVPGQRVQYRLLPGGEPETFHSPDEPPLAVTDTGETVDQGIVVPMKIGPAGLIVDV